MVSMVGLSYAFPNGIDRNKLKYKGRFAEIIDALPKFPAQIQRLEKICSTIYAITFLMFMLMVGAFLGIVVLSVLVISWMVIHPGSFNAAMEHIDLYFNIVILVLAVPYIIDFVTLGGLKRVKWLHVIYRLLSTVTLSPIYRPVYYGIVSNFKKRYVISGLVVYMAISIWMYFVVGNKSFSAHDMYPPFSKVSEYTGYFEDHTEGPISRFAHVPPRCGRRKRTASFCRAQQRYGRLHCSGVQYRRASPQKISVQERVGEHALSQLFLYPGDRQRHYSGAQPGFPETRALPSTRPSNLARFSRIRTRPTRDPVALSLQYRIRNGRAFYYIQGDSSPQPSAFSRRKRNPA